MIDGLKLPGGLNVRPSNAGDRVFLESLYKSTREDLELIEDDSGGDFIEYLKDQQLDAQTEGYGDQFPDALYLIIEYHQESVGRVVVDFGHNEIRVVDLALVKAARGKGLGTGVLQAFIAISEQIMAPLTLAVLSSNVGAKRLYLQLGFVVEEVVPPRELMTYYPRSQGIRVGP